MNRLLRPFLCLIAAAWLGVPSASAADLGAIGGIEVGSKGVKPTVLIFRQTAEGIDYDIKSAGDKQLKAINTDLGNLKAGSDREFDLDRMSKTLKAIAALNARMREHYGLGANRIRVVVSSGVFSGFAADAVEPARAKLLAAIKQATGQAPSFVDAIKETEYSARSAIAPAARGRALLIDIGSGNARVGSFQKNGFQAISIENGTGRLQRAIAKEAEAKGVRFATLAAGFRDKLIARPLHEKLAVRDVTAGKSEAYLVGGASWALSTLTQPNRIRQTRAEVNPGDLVQFSKIARMAPAEASRIVLADVRDPELHKLAAAEVARVQKVFSPEQLIAGAEILQAFAAECKLEQAKVYFYRKGQSAWIAGYLAESLGIQ